MTEISDIHVPANETPSLPHTRINSVDRAVDHTSPGSLDYEEIDISTAISSTMQEVDQEAGNSDIPDQFSPEVASNRRPANAGYMHMVPDERESYDM